MKRNYIPTFVVSVILFSVFSSCTEEKTFVLDGYEGGLVNFTVVNPALPDTAVSMLDYYGDYYERERAFKYRYPEDGYTYEKCVRLSYRGETWIGGYNPVTITFKPSCPEEKEATFTMPDGQMRKVAAGESFNWEIDSVGWAKMIEQDDNFGDVRIMAESEYSKNHTTYRNYGFVRLMLDGTSVFMYDALNKEWYYHDWTENPNVFVPGSRVNY